MHDVFNAGQHKTCYAETPIERTRTAATHPDVLCASCGISMRHIQSPHCPSTEDPAAQTLQAQVQQEQPAPLAPPAHSLLLLLPLQHLQTASHLSPLLLQL
jgi:hypothetical protein